MKLTIKLQFWQFASHYVFYTYPSVHTPETEAWSSPTLSLVGSKIFGHRRSGANSSNRFGISFTIIFKGLSIFQRIKY